MVDVTATASAGTVNVTDVSCFPGLRVVALACTSHASAGTVTATLKNIMGALKRVAIAPSGGGTAPTDDFDMTVTDGWGVDVFAARGANIDNATVLNFQPQLQQTIDDLTDDKFSFTPMPTFGDLALAVTNAGNSKQFTITLFIAPEF